ncbi:MAG: diguanylate cyclase [Myxococcota bacterium]
MPQGPVAKIMSADVERIGPDASIAEVAERMSEKRISCVLVLEGEEPVGIISERDLLRVFTEHARDGRLAETARDLMSAPLISIHEEALVSEAVSRTRSLGIRRLVVVDSDDQLAGIVTQTDLMEAYVQEVESQRDELEAQVRQRTLELEESNRMLESMSRVDALMGIGNRRGMELTLDSTHERARRYGTRYSVALLDIDHFKAFNDSYGHLKGDDILRCVAESLRDQLRASDEIYRYGGEEILMLLTETSLDDAVRAAERARGIVEGLAIEHEGAPRGHVTLSAGVAEVGAVGGVAEECWKPVVARADAALYEAKREGRNRVVAGPFAPEASVAPAAPHEGRS